MTSGTKTIYTKFFEEPKDKRSPCGITMKNHFRL